MTMKDFTIVITMERKFGDLYVLLSLLKDLDIQRMVISNGFELPRPEELGVDYTKNIPDNPGHQAGVIYLMKAANKALLEVPLTKWIIHVHCDVFILDFDKIMKLTQAMIDQHKTIAGFAWYGEGTLSTDFFVADMKWVLDVSLFDFALNTGFGVEGELYYRATLGNTDSVLIIPYDVTFDPQEMRDRAQGGARNFPWREEMSIMHDHLGEYDCRMKNYPLWSDDVREALIKYRGYRDV